MAEDDRLTTILILDSDSLARRALERCLRASHYEVRTASRTAEAFALIEAEPLSLLIASFEVGQPCESLAVLIEARTQQPTCGRVLIADSVVQREIAEAALTGLCHVVLQRPFAISEALAYAETSRAETLRRKRTSSSVPRAHG